MPKTAIVFATLFGAVILAASLILPFQLMNSEPDLILADILFGLPVTLLIAGLSLWATSRAIRRHSLTFRKATSLYAGVLFLAFSAFQITSHCLVPSNIDYAFSYPGNTGSYHMVQFYFRHDGHWLEGPSVEGWPLTVSFPDLNGDGHPDIRVTDNANGGSVEFVYLPKNDGHCFWRAVKNETRLSAGYPPGHYFSNYP
jgi:hypothetical protein